MPALSAAQAPPAGASEPFVVEYYYKTRWGFADEFIRLFKKNHFPVLKREIELGHIQRVTAEAPRFQDRKSTRLNSSHLVISYAVFCLKKKKIKNKIRLLNTQSTTPVNSSNYCASET